MKDFKDYDPTLAAPLVREFEGLNLKAYRCPAGVLTIGYGHTYGVEEGDTVTQDEAERILKRDLKGFAAETAQYVKVPVTEGQYIAILDFVFNFGVSKFRHSTFLKKLNFGDYDGAGKEILKWKYSNGKVLPGLERRRKSEYDLFMEG